MRINASSNVQGVHMRKQKSWWQKLNDYRVRAAARRPYVRELKKFAAKFVALTEELDSVIQQEFKLSKKRRVLRDKKRAVKYLMDSAQEKLDAIK
jgi:hypothetical protein